MKGSFDYVKISESKGMSIPPGDRRGISAGDCSTFDVKDRIDEDIDPSKCHSKLWMRLLMDLAGPCPALLIPIRLHVCKAL